MKLHEYAAYDALGLMSLIKRGDVTSGELQDCALKAIEELNPALNFMASTPAKAAFSSDGPFSGLPFLIKEGHGCVGHPAMTATRICAGINSPTDSIYVQRLKKAGVAAIGATTASEFGIYPVSESSIHGLSRNPWNLDHSPGGSSGGSSAAVAAGVVPVASSSDGGGSIRLPAHCTGTFGLKPTIGRVASAGTGDGGLFPFSHFHVTSRSVRDSAAFLDALEGPVLGSRHRTPRPERPFIQEVGADPGKLRIAVTRQIPVASAVHADCLSAVDDAAKLCESLGHHVEEAAPKIDWGSFMAGFTNAWITLLPFGISHIELLTGRKAGSDTLEPMTLKLLERARQQTPTDLIVADLAFQAARRAVDEFFTQYDAWITPGAVSPAPRVGDFNPATAVGTFDEYGKRSISDFAAFHPLLNATGHPAASVPLFHGAISGLPIGVQVVTGMCDEATLLRLAAQWESARPWKRRVPAHSIFGSR